MKKNKNKLLIIALMLTSFLLLFSFPVKADSGFDSDFDFGDSDFDFGGSDFDYDYDYDYGSGGVIVGPMSSVVTIIVIIIIIAFIITAVNKNKTTNTVYVEESRLLDDDIYSKLGTDFDYEDFKHLVFDNYKKIQIAWMDNEIESVRSLLSDYLFNTYKTQLLTLSNKNQKNMMEDINYEGAYITGIKKKEETEEIEVTLIVTCRDYIIDTTSKEVLRGDSNRVNRYYYKLTFERTSDIEDSKFCPNCGAPLPKGKSAKCEYCRSVIIKKTNNYILTDKKMIKQEIVR